MESRYIESHCGLPLRFQRGHGRHRSLIRTRECRIVNADDLEELFWPFPESHYRHIFGSMHDCDDWRKDLRSPELDRFFVCPQSDGWLGRWLGVLGPEIDDGILAFFNTCLVYGKARCLGRNEGTLAQEDLLVFYAGLRPPAARYGSRLYLIGYFTVQNVHNVTAQPPWPPPCLQHLWANAHFRRASRDPGLVVVEGSPHASRLFGIAVPLSDERQEVLPEMQCRLGLTGSVKRAGAGRWIPETCIANVEQWLRAL